MRSRPWLRRWIRTRLTNTLAVFTFAAGLIWDRFGPAYVFFTFVSLDLLVRAPTER